MSISKTTNSQNLFGTSKTTSVNNLKDNVVHSKNMIKNNEKIKKVVCQFEATFYKTLLEQSEAFKSDNDNFFTSNATNEFEDIFSDHLALELSKANFDKPNNLGISKMLYEQISKSSFRNLNSSFSSPPGLTAGSSLFPNQNN